MALPAMLRQNRPDLSLVIDGGIGLGRLGWGWRDRQTSNYQAADHQKSDGPKADRPRSVRGGPSDPKWEGSVGV
ncbi:MAG: hypothetical protein ACOVNV_10800, partial [Pirellulaceae bacterium]